MKIGIIKNIPAWKKGCKQNNFSLIQNIENSDLLSKITAIKDKEKSFNSLLFIAQGNYPETTKKAAAKILTEDVVDIQKSCFNKEETHMISLFYVTGTNKAPNVFHTTFSDCVKHVNNFPVDIKTERQGENLVSTVKKDFIFNKKLNYCQIENGEFKNFTIAAKLANFYTRVKYVKNDCIAKIKAQISFCNKVSEAVFEVIKKKHPEIDK